MEMSEYPITQRRCLFLMLLLLDGDQTELSRASTLEVPAPTLVKRESDVKEGGAW